MLTLKLRFIVLLMALNLPFILKAQPDYTIEISCNEVCNADSALFFQEIQPERYIISGEGTSTYRWETAYDEFPDIRKSILTALSFYPELDSVRIRFLYKPIRQTMNSRPSLGNMFRSNHKRRYTIIINISEGENRGLPIEKLSSTIKTGWIGHELAHICAYMQMSNLQVIWFTFRYISSKKFMRKVERYTDMVTIKHGLAYPLYAGSHYLLNSKDIHVNYKKHSAINGLTPAEIFCIWCKLRKENIDNVQQ
jgi:hypothetical protein